MAEAVIGTPYPLPDNYLKILNETDTIELVIIGKDPYPGDPVGIPFCKDTWGELFKYNCSGRYVLNALGYEENDIQKGKYGCPSTFFEYLATKRGIAFLNISYHYLGGPLRKRNHESYINEAYGVNEPILRKAKIIICCGEANKLRWTGFKGDGVSKVVHPAIINSVSTHEQVKKGWLKIWGTMASLQSKNCFQDKSGNSI